MKKLLLMTTAIAGVAMLSQPASALELNLGGYFRGYGVNTDNNELTATDLRSFEFRRDMELHVDGETTLDNGMTIGAHGEIQVGNTTPNDGSSGANVNTVAADEIYAFASGNWGRFNFGVEDGAAYLLQVNAPSADSNIDGVRVYIQALNSLEASQNSDFGTASVFANSDLLNPSANLDYDHADNRTSDRLTYMTPKINGFQAGVSYAPKRGLASNTGTMSSQAGTVGIHTIALGGDTAATYDELYEVSARYDGQLQGVMFSLGGGYSQSNLMKEDTAANVAAYTGGVYSINDDTKAWNAGLNLSMQGFSLGGSYMRALSGRIAQTDTTAATTATNVSGDITSDTYVVGGAYDNGPYHVGLSYLNQQVDYDALGAAGAVSDVTKSKHETDKFTLGGGYTFGPGVTFRGSVAWGTFDNTGNDGTSVLSTVNYSAADSNDFTQVGVGLDVQF